MSAMTIPGATDGAIDSGPGLLGEGGTEIAAGPSEEAGSGSAARPVLDDSASPSKSSPPYPRETSTSSHPALRRHGSSLRFPIEERRLPLPTKRRTSRANGQSPRPPPLPWPILRRLDPPSGPFSRRPFSSHLPFGRPPRLPKSSRLGPPPFPTRWLVAGASLPPALQEGRCSPEVPAGSSGKRILRG